MRVKILYPFVFSLVSTAFGAGNQDRPFAFILDPGHGGADSGIRHAALLEKTLTLEIARNVQASFKDRTDVRVVLTRNDDYLLSLDDRKKVANSNSPGVYVSLHFAAAPTSELHGPRVYVLAAPKVSGIAALPNVEEAHGTSLNESWRLAMILSQALAHLGASEPARIAPIPLAPLLGVTIPSVLIELDYLTASGASRWADPGTISTAAAMIAEGLDRFLKPDSPLDRTPAQRDNPAP